MRPQEKPVDSAVPVAYKPEARARLSNGRQLFIERVDGRSLPARRFRDVLQTFLSQTGGRNVDLCRVLASLVVQKDLLDLALARGEPVDTQDLIRVAGAISRLMTKLGIVEAHEPETDVPLPSDAPAWLLGRRETAEPAT